MPEKKATYTTGDVAKMCGVSEKSVWNWASCEKGPRHTKTPGRHLRFDGEALAQWLAENEFRVPKELRCHLNDHAMVGQELLEAIDHMDATQRKSLLETAEKMLRTS